MEILILLILLVVVSAYVILNAADNHDSAFTEMKERIDQSTNKHAVIKYKDGLLALHCNGCDVIIEHGDILIEDREHYCSVCMSSKCCTK